MLNLLLYQYIVIVISDIMAHCLWQIYRMSTLHLGFYSDPSPTS